MDDGEFVRSRLVCWRREEPLYPRMRTFCARLECPFWGQKQTSPTYSVTSSAAFKPCNRYELTFRKGHAWLPFDIRVVASKTVAVCSSSPETRCNRNRQSSARKSHGPTGLGIVIVGPRTSRDPPDRNGVPPASRPYTRRLEYARQYNLVRMTIGSALKIALGVVCFGIGAACLIGAICILPFISASDAAIPRNVRGVRDNISLIAFLFLRRVRWYTD